MRIPRILLTHPFELCVSWATLGMGVSSFSRGQPFSAAVERDLVWALMLAWQAGVVLGSVMVIASLVLRRDPMTEVRRVVLRGIERSGLYFTAASAWVFALVIAFGGTGTGYAIGILTGVGAACVFRTIALRRADQATVEAFRSEAASDSE